MSARDVKADNTLYSPRLFALQESGHGTSRQLGLAAPMGRQFEHSSECQQPGSLGQFLALKMYQLALISLAFPIAFQADDEGSIPLTRSNLFRCLRR